ncbi:hypothetical protein SCH01S_53_00300 [Sphingomonas changbaiensis NBRC 104936]|uniref:SURF1-like protein n=1 Tax=Sphingomonas changbaiensis NBRC 104936 TaxID=1219043 RepID=A0A0E9MU10_9SPHN|nr:SURF1 family protein [Sphingomonas changbaiensis]GAO40958.1 hypothetical protein SCH01S_53_00300 [Sphingomonas changbaiensis NBRC 104936]
MMLVLLAGTMLFIALGLWQVERRSEKLALIAAVQARVHAAPVAAPGPAEWARINAATDAYRRVRVHGAFLNDSEILVQAVSRYGPGYWVLTPLRTDQAWTVLVNRGFVPPELRSRASRHAEELKGPVEVTGLLRVTEPHGGFLHANDPAHDRWYSRDVAAIGRARHLSHLAPYFIDAAAGPSEKRQPVGGLTVLSFPNNHLQYALTWFGLAVLALLGVWRVRRRP